MAEMNKVPPPMFTVQPAQQSGELSAQTQAAVEARGNPTIYNLDEIFGDVMFTPDGDTVFQKEDPNQLMISSAEVTNIATNASTPGTVAGEWNQVRMGGGVQTTQLTEAGKPALTMGPATTETKPVQPVSYDPSKPQKPHHLAFALSSKPKKKPSGSRSSDRSGKMSDEQKKERRERNREHAKRSRIRKKFLLESLQQSVTLLKEENDKLKGAIRTHLGDEKAERLLSNNTDAASSDGLLANSQGTANKVLDDPDFSFIKALQTAQQNFVVTDPSLPDNPIVYASQGFLNLTGYSLDQILGRNCRFLQGPETDPKSVEKIRKSIEEGTDMSVCLLNYRVDGTTFWNQFFIAALRDSGGSITNYVGVQCKVSDQYAATVTKQQEEEEEGEDATAAAANVDVAASAGAAD